MKWPNWSKYQQQLQESRLAVRSREIAQKIKPWGFEGVDLYFVTRFFVEGVQKGALTTRAAAISFRLFLAVFPGLILLLSLIPVVPIENFQDNLFDNIQGFFPGDTFTLVEDTLNTVINKKHNTLLSIGFVLVIFYASNSMNAILLGFNGSYHIDKKHNPFFMRIASILLLFILGVFMIIAVALIIFSGHAVEYLITEDWVQPGASVVLLDVARWGVTIGLIYISISTLYNAGNFRRIKWKVFSAGASFATIFFILASILFAWFVNNVAQFNRLYGSLGTLMVLLIWMTFNLRDTKMIQ
jgi:membrane protein